MKCLLEWKACDPSTSNGWFFMNFFSCVTKPFISSFTVNNAGTIRSPYTKLSMVHQDHPHDYFLYFSSWYDEAWRRYWTYCDQNHTTLTKWWRCGVHPRLTYTLVQSERIIKRTEYCADWTMHVQVQTTFPFMARQRTLPYSHGDVLWWKVAVFTVSYLHYLNYLSNRVWSVLAYPIRSRDAWCKTWHFLLPVGGTPTVPDYYRFCLFRMWRQSYSSDLDPIKQCMTEI